MGAFTAFCEGVPISGSAVAVDVVLYRVRACGGWCSCRGVLVFLLIIGGLHVAVFGVYFYYMEKFKPGCGCGCSVFVEKTNKEKKTRKRANFYLKSVDTDMKAY